MTEVSQNDGRFAGVTLAVPAPSRQWVTKAGDIDWALRREAFAAAMKLGFRVRELEGTFHEDARFAGSDAMRARDLTAAMTELEADLVMAMRGGYGVGRLFDDLDWEKLGDSQVPIVGYSDFTAFELALLAKTGRMSWQGPTLRDLINPDEKTLLGLEMVLGRRPFEVIWTTQDELINVANGGTSLAVEGTLWGGNLSMIASLVGTPYMPEIEDGILFIEDVAEPAYRIERMLLTLDMAGILRRQKAVIVCDLQGADRPVGWEEDFSLAHVLRYMRARTGIPFVTGLPFGHIHGKWSLPVGMRVMLRVDDQTACLEAL